MLTRIFVIDLFKILKLLDLSQFIATSGWHNECFKRPQNHAMHILWCSSGVPWRRGSGTLKLALWVTNLIFEEAE